MIHSDIIIIGAGAAGLMAAASAPGSLVLEKMPRPGRKIAITGKGRCNFTNVSPWQEFSAHIHPKANPLKHAFYSLQPEKLIGFFADAGLPAVVERGNRAFPASYKAVDVIDALERAVRGAGSRIVCSCPVTWISLAGSSGAAFAAEPASAAVSACDSASAAVSACDSASAASTTMAASNASVTDRFIVHTPKADYSCRKLIITCGGLAYPSTGSTGDGYSFARCLGHKVTRLYPSLTALVPKDYKDCSDLAPLATPETPVAGRISPRHIPRETPLGPLGRQYMGRSIKNVSVTLLIDRQEVATEFGDVDFTDGGIEGPIGFKLSRRAVNAIDNGGKVALRFDFKKGEPLCFDIAGYVGWERAVVTAGGVSTDEIVPKTMESRLCPGLYFAGEIIDYDADTGGYNLQLAFATGHLAGVSASE